jgi:hypothetical protein
LQQAERPDAIRSQPVLHERAHTPFDEHDVRDHRHQDGKRGHDLHAREERELMCVSQIVKPVHYLFNAKTQRRKAWQGRVAARPKLRDERQLVPTAKFVVSIFISLRFGVLVLN